MRKTVQFFAQGDLDHLCGPYAAVNALVALGVVSHENRAREILLDFQYEIACHWHKDLMISKGLTAGSLARMWNTLDSSKDINISLPFRREHCPASNQIFWRSLHAELNIDISEGRSLVL